MLSDGTACLPRPPGHDDSRACERIGLRRRVPKSPVFRPPEPNDELGVIPDGMNQLQVAIFR